MNYISSVKFNESSDVKSRKLNFGKHIVDLTEKQIKGSDPFLLRSISIFQKNVALHLLVSLIIRIKI